MIESVEDWWKYAPPVARELHWKPGRSAYELARRWVSGAVPPEVRAVLQSEKKLAGFVPDSGYAGTATLLDNLRGGNRSQDLVLVGSTGDAPAVVVIEGKSDERFGLTIGERLAKAAEEMARNPKSQGRLRVQELCRAIFGCEPEEAADLRYQLLHGAAAALIRARQSAADRVAYVVHEFRTNLTEPDLLERNEADLRAFIHRLGGRYSRERLAGPFRVPGNAHVPDDVALYMGMVTCSPETQSG